MIDPLYVWILHDYPQSIFIEWSTMKPSAFGRLHAEGLKEGIGPMPINEKKKTVTASKTARRRRPHEATLPQEERMNEEATASTVKPSAACRRA